jgi:hypothetical protein
VNVMLDPAQKILSASVLVIVADGNAYTVFVNPGDVPAHPLELTAITSIIWPFERELVV